MSQYTINTLVIGNKNPQKIRTVDDLKAEIRHAQPVKDQYFCLCDLENNEAPFIQAILVSGRNFQLEYKNSDGYLFKSVNTHYSQADVINIFIQVFTQQWDKIDAIDWVSQDVNDSALRKESTSKVFTLVLSPFDDVKIHSLEELLTALALITHDKFKFATLTEKGKNRFIQTSVSTKDKYVIEYQTESGRHYSCESLLTSDEIKDCFANYYYGNMRWTNNYAWNVDDYSEVERPAPSALKRFLWHVFGFGLAFVLMNYSWVLERFAPLILPVFIAVLMFGGLYFLYRIAD